jgi:hypothetical protein
MARGTLHTIQRTEQKCTAFGGERSDGLVAFLDAVVVVLNPILASYTPTARRMRMRMTAATDGTTEALAPREPTHGPGQSPSENPRKGPVVSTGLAWFEARSS